MRVQGRTGYRARCTKPPPPKPPKCATVDFVNEFMYSLVVGGILIAFFFLVARKEDAETKVRMLESEAHRREYREREIYGFRDRQCTGNQILQALMNEGKLTSAEAWDEFERLFNKGEIRILQSSETTYNFRNQQSTGNQIVQALMEDGKLTSAEAWDEFERLFRAGDITKVQS